MEVLSVLLVFVLTSSLCDNSASGPILEGPRDDDREEGIEHKTVGNLTELFESPELVSPVSNDFLWLSQEQNRNATSEVQLP